MEFERNKMAEALNVALANSFEGLAFIEFDSWDEVEDIPESADKQYSTSVEISVPFKTQLSLVCSEQFILSMIESITGEEVVENKSVIPDTLKEILNTFAGRFMVKLLSNGVEFDFGIPDFQVFENGLLKITESDIVLKFTYDEETVFCALNNFSGTN